MEPGILHFNINVLKMIISDFTPSQLRGTLKIDEKSITPACVYDQNLKMFIGNVTLPPSSLTAQNAYVVYLCLMDIRVKIVTGCHFTDKSTSGEAQKASIFELIREIESKTGVIIDLISLDIGPINSSFLKSVGVSFSKGSRINSFRHPYDSSRVIRVNPDQVHNLKNVTLGFRNHDVRIQI